MGETDLPNSFVKYLADKIFHADFPPKLIDNITLFSLVAAIAGAIIVRVKLLSR